MKNFRRKLPGTHYNYEALIGSPERLKQLMDMPLSECLSYCEKANTVDPEDAICYLADMYIENCGVSLSMRGFADYCSNYWIKKLEMESNTEMSEKYHGALTLGQILPYVSEKYHDGLLDEYDSCVMSHKELRNILFEQIKNLIDEKVKFMIFWSKCKQDVKILSNFAIRQGIIPLQKTTNKNI